MHTDLTIENSIAFHEVIGIARKEARLRWLQQYWTTKVRGYGKIVHEHPVGSEAHRRDRERRRAGHASRAISAKVLLEKYKVFTVAIDGAGVHGVRVTPQVYTSTRGVGYVRRGAQGAGGVG